MTNKIVFFLLFVAVVSFSAKAQRSVQIQNDEAVRRSVSVKPSSASNQTAGVKLPENKPLGKSRYKPEITKEDLNAIAIDAADSKAFAEFLKQKNTGIVRLHNGEICSPQNLVVEAVGGCPNNISGKATGYSFRENDYKTKSFADLFFANNKFSSTGIFTIGIFSSFENLAIDKLTVKSDGIKQLIEFQPPEKETEIERQSQMLRKGIQVGNNIYKRDYVANENATFVLRTIAYKGKLFRGTGTAKVNILENDSRKDITVIFRIVRKHSDGSVTIIWKKLIENASPKIILENKDSEKVKKTNFSGNFQTSHH